MKVYTHFFGDASGKEGLRWRTILQFGSSWEIIGSVVMKNPGTSHPNNDSAITDEDLVDKLTSFDDSSSPWYEFSGDATMRCVAELFASYYNIEVSELSGVIQIFNLFYVKDEVLARALGKDKNSKLPPLFHTPEEMVAYDLCHLVAPVYLGFGGLKDIAAYRDRARKFFDVARNALGMKYLNPAFEDNPFFHPLYLQRYGKRKEACQEVLARFKAFTTSSKLAIK